MEPSSPVVKTLIIPCGRCFRCPYGPSFCSARVRANISPSSSYNFFWPLEPALRAHMQNCMPKSLHPLEATPAGGWQSCAKPPPSHLRWDNPKWHALAGPQSPPVASSSGSHSVNWLDTLLLVWKRIQKVLVREWGHERHSKARNLHLNPCLRICF